ncbi:MAG TPA: helix-turn-helix domain-containing protein [Candidatus Eisenbacteria bacterium]|nr:helix-turn-helix domain-containing protein [Candidatus Eisenbacteria bacterium]
MKTHLGHEVRRLRLQAAIPLRGLAARLGISPAHLSDIEHSRRRPSEQLLRKIASELCDVGASFEALELLVTGADPETREWLGSTPGVRALLRTIIESGRSPQEINLVLQKSLGLRKRAKAPIASRRRTSAIREVRAGRQAAGGER